MSRTDDYAGFRRRCRGIRADIAELREQTPPWDSDTRQQLDAIEAHVGRVELEIQRRDNGHIPQ